MTKDNFHFLVPDICSTVKNPKELLDTLKSFIVSNYNVGELLEKRTNEFLAYAPSNDILWNEFIPKPGILVLPDNTSNNDLEILDLLNTLKDIASSKTKESILINWFNDQSEYMKELFLKFIHLTFSSIFTFNATLRIFTEDNISLSGNIYTLEYVLVQLESIGMDNDTKPKEKIEKILDLYNSSTEETKKIIQYIVSRELDIKMNEKTFYDALNPLCKEKRILLVPYQRCEKEDKIDRITFPCMAQLKADGKFQNLIFDPMRGLGLTLNRSGMRSNLKVFEYFDQFNNETKYFEKVWLNQSVVFTGEALVKKPNETILGKSALDINVYEREIGNGLLGSYGNRFSTFKTLFYDVVNAIDNKGNKKIFKRLEKLIRQLLEWKYVEDNTIFQVWNILPLKPWSNLDSGFTCIKGLQYCNDFILNYNNWLQSKNIDTNLILIHNEFFEDMDSVYDLYYRVLDKKMEGLVVKNLNAGIYHGTSTEGIIKLKDFKDTDLKVIGYEPGTGKYVGGIGSLICTTECGRMILNVSGLTDKQRGFIRVDPNNSAKGLMLDPNHSNDKFNDKIVTVKYNKLSSDKTGKPSLSLPSIMEERTDVTRAQFFHEIKK